MFPTTPTSGLLADAELSYRRERLAADVASARRVLAVLARLRRRPAAGAGELTLAA